MELMASILVMAFACLVKGFLRSREMSRDKLSQPDFGEVVGEDMIDDHDLKEQDFEKTSCVLIIETIMQSYGCFVCS